MNDAVTKAERRVMLAAMRYYRHLGEPPSLTPHNYSEPMQKLIASCAMLKHQRSLPKAFKCKIASCYRWTKHESGLCFQHKPHR